MHNARVSRSSPHDAARAVLLDVTRLVALQWTGRYETGIDRVCRAYLRHFRHQARAVVQHRGAIRVLTARASAEIFDTLESRSILRRAQTLRLLSFALLKGPSAHDLRGRAYLNLGHTDFDLVAHQDWVRQVQVRPFYFVHDLIPILQPEFSRPHAVQRHLGRVVSALKTAAGIIVSSQVVQHELMTFAKTQNLPLPPVAIAPLAGADFAARSPVAGSVPASDPPFFLCVGTIEPRKNHHLLFAVWQHLFALLGERTPRLIIIGQTGPLTGELLAPLKGASGWQRHVEHRRFCSDTELASMMQQAHGLLVPTLAEGFGLPLVEALQLGTPVIASNLAVFREIGQGAANLLDPCAESAWVEAVLNVSQAARRSTREKSMSVMGQPSFDPPRWPDHFKVIEQFIADPAAFATRGSGQPQTESVFCA